MKLLLVGAFAFVVIFVLYPVLRGSGHPEIRHKVFEVPEVERPTDISIAVDSDEDGSLHLAWSSRDADVPRRGVDIRYARSDDGGETWSEPVYLGDVGTVQNLFAHHGVLLLVFSQGTTLLSQKSFDSGSNWSPSQVVSDDIDPRGLAIAGYGNHLYLVDQDANSIVFSQSEDFGESWSGSQTVGELGNSGLTRSVSIAASNGHVFAYCVARGGPYVIESVDGGRSWKTPEALDGVLRGDKWDRFSPYYGGLVVSDVAAIVFLEGVRTTSKGAWEGGFYNTYRGVEGGSWSSPKVLKGGGYIGNMVALSVKGHVYVALTDKRHEVHDWFGYIWFPGFYGLEAWANNDLIVRSMGRDGKWEDRLITPPLSFVSSLPARTKKLVAAGDKLYVFWTGQKKVGKSRDTYGYPNQIFFAKFDFES